MCEFLEYEGGDFRELPANGGPDDLMALWHKKKTRSRHPLPARTQGPARAQLRESREPRELKWPGGKAGRS